MSCLDAAPLLLLGTFFVVLFVAACAIDRRIR